MLFDQVSSIPIKLYNTESQQVEFFKPLRDKHVRIYTCGPTVYNYAHIGNFRTYIFEDLLRRTLQFFGYTVTQVMNLTDIDDKTLKGAIAQGITLNEYTTPFIQAFFEDLKTLHIQPAEHYPAATQFIPEMIAMVEQLLEKGIAYKGSDGSIYYSISHFPLYGRLSHLHIDELKAGASKRVSTDEYGKDNISDFVLWKAYDPERDGKIFWDSPFGKGRPGWHLECSAMAMKLLGETIDIHMGGVDNMFPHHENEIAQSEACSGKQFVRFWMHSEHLVVDHKKMSKSLGNFYTLRDLLQKGYTGIQVRYMLLQTHYKTQLNFTFEGLEAVKSSLNRLQDFIYRLQCITKPGPGGAVDAHLEKAIRGFATSLADDLNISPALAAIFDLVREINTLCDEDRVTQQEAEKILDALKAINNVLAVLSFDLPEDNVPSDLKEMLERRIEARKSKNWALSDHIRNEIHSRGYTIEDTPNGARLKREGG